jgi:hypothetical protein
VNHGPVHVGSTIPQAMTPDSVSHGKHGWLAIGSATITIYKRPMCFDPKASSRPETIGNQWSNGPDNL